MLVRGIPASRNSKRLAHPVYDFPVCAVFCAAFSRAFFCCQLFSGAPPGAACTLLFPAHVFSCHLFSFLREGPVGRLPADSRGVIPGGRDGRRREGTSGRGPPPYPQFSRQMVSMLGNAHAPSPARGSGSIGAMLGLQLHLQRSPSARKT